MNCFEDLNVKGKRVYYKPSEDYGFRILADRLWPRALSKDKAKLDLWLKDITPSNELRNWSRHDPKKRNEFKARYFKELDNKKELVDLIINKARKGVVTLLYAAKEEKFNNAIALKECIETKIGNRSE